MLSWFRRTVRRINLRIWLVLGGIVLVLIILMGLPQSGSGLTVEIVQLTIDAASARANAGVPTITTLLTQTPPQAILTGAAPTLSLAGQLEIRQFAASARADSQIDVLHWGAIQAVGPPNTPECGDFRTAWASAQPNQVASLTVFFPELVTPTWLLIYETFNPGFITRITFIDVFGEIHTIYEATPQPAFQCPFVLVVPIANADYHGTTVTIFLDQTTSTGGWNQIDAVELIGIKY